MPQDTIHNSTPVKQVAAEVRKRQCAGAQEHLEKVAQFIATFEADIVNLVDVEGCSNLEALVVDGGAAALRGSYTGYVRQGTDRATGQDVALLTRCELTPAAHGWAIALDCWGRP